MSRWTRRGLGPLFALALTAGCTHTEDVSDPLAGHRLALEKTSSGWAAEGGTSPEQGSLFYILDSRPLPGSDVPPVIGVAQAAAQGAVNILYTNSGTTLSDAGLNRLVPVGAEEEVRVNAEFARATRAEDGAGVTLNIGAFDGVAAGMSYDLLTFDPQGKSSVVARCKAHAADVLQSTTLCTLESGECPRREQLFAVALDEGELAVARGGLSEAGCQLALPEGGALEALGNEAVCGLLDEAWHDFADRFGPLGDGGSHGIYIDQSYVDPNYMPEDIDSEWTVPPERARMTLRVRTWLDDPDQRVLVIFGPMGAGKTTFSRRFAYELAIQTATRGSGPVPVRVALSDVLAHGEIMGDESGPALVARVLQRVTLKTVSPEQVRRDIEVGAILPFFDGFDEVSLGGRVMEALAYYDALVASTVGETGKMIVLTRSSDRVGEPLAGLTLALDQRVQSTPSQTQLRLIPFSEDIVDRYLERLVPDPELRERTRLRLQESFDLGALARTPVLVYLVAGYVANETPGDEMPAEMYSLYREYVGDWAGEHLGKHGTTDEQIQSFLWRCVAMGMALDLYQTPSITEPVLSSFISANPWLRAKVDPDFTWDLALLEARGRAFLQPAPLGGYRFVDPSWANYFAAEGWIQTLLFVWQEDPPDWAPDPILDRLETLHPTDQTLRFLREGMGPDPLADSGLQFLLAHATQPTSTTTLYRLRQMRQGVTGEEAAGREDPISRRSRFSYQELYQKENTELQAIAQQGVSRLLEHPAGARYEAMPNQPGRVRDTEDGSVWAYVPDLTYLTGTVGEAGSSLEHKPNPAATLVAVYPVTNQQFWDFYQKSGYQPHSSLRAEGVVPFLKQLPRTRVGSADRGLRFVEELASHPVTAISWLDMQAYVQWHSQALGVSERVPNELEWELAARGRLGRTYPWGDAFDTSRAQSNAGPETGTRPVDAYPSGMSPFGVMDMAGNTWEWVHPADLTTFSKTGVMRGGSFDTPAAQLTTQSRKVGYERGEYRFADAGFRLAREVPMEIWAAPAVEGDEAATLPTE